jgi:SAM-dependent methyltransferase
MLEFDEAASRRVEATYLTPDIVDQRRVFIEALGLEPGEKVLDIGAGPGLLAADMAPALGPEGAVLGIEPSESMRALAAHREAAPGAAPMTFRDGDALALALEDESFDVAVSTQVYEYIADIETALSEAHRVLRPGGRLLVSTHGTFIYHPDPEDLWRWTAAGLERAVENAGFRVVRTEGMLGLLPTGLQLVQDAIYWHLPRLLRPPFAWVMQGLVALGDRLHGDESRRLNAQVYGVVAEKP